MEICSKRGCYAEAIDGYKTCTVCRRKAREVNARRRPKHKKRGEFVPLKPDEFEAMQD